MRTGSLFSMALAGCVAATALGAAGGEPSPGWQDGLASSISPEAYAVCDDVVAVKLINQVFKRSPEKMLKAADIKVLSDDDAEFSSGVSPKRFGYWTRPIRYTMRKDLNIKGTWIFAFLDKRLKPGKTYSVRIEGVKFADLDEKTGFPLKSQSPAPEQSFAWHGEKSKSTAIHANQAGYLPNGPKFAYLSQYAGARDGSEKDFIDVDFSSRKEFTLLSDKDGSEVFRGPLKLSAVCSKDGTELPDRLCGSRVWEMDFSQFKTPGRYRAAVEGVGCSYPFDIDAKAYNTVFGTLMRGCYQQRCGTALEKEWTRHTHPPCHMDDARIPSLDEYKRPQMDFYPQKGGRTLPCAKGHHDAGDYGKYVANGSLFAYYILQAYEIAPEKLSFDASPLPEAGDKTSDLLEEAKWELDWLSNMQDSDDGGVFIIVKPKPTMSYEDGIPGAPGDSSQRCVWWKEINTTADFAAILARAARTPEFARKYPAEAKAYMEKALKAWDFCMKHTESDGAPADLISGGHHYGAMNGALDDYCWMAAELWLTTGDSKYHDYFLKFHLPEQGRLWGWFPLKDHSGAATRAYAFGKREGKDPKMLKACVDEVLRAAREAVTWQKGWAMRPSFPESPYRFGKWGWLFLGELASYNLLTAAEIVPEPERSLFVEAALFNADQEFGNSADDICAYTGTGFKRATDHVHQQSRFDEIVEPVPGIPLGFHPAGYNRGKGDRELMASYCYGGLPPAYRFVDCFNIEQEFTVPALSQSVACYALLADAKSQRPGKPELNIRANGNEETARGEAPFKVQFKAEAKGANGKAIRSYYWDFDTEESASSKDFDYTFRTPGIYSVCCTACDEDGWIACKTLKVEVAQPLEERPNKGEPMAQAPDSLGLWHFDGSTKDISGREATLSGKASLDDGNLLWMKAPSGKAVKMSAAEDGVRIVVERDLLSPDKTKKFSVEAFACYLDDVPRGSGHSEILTLSPNRNYVLGLKKDTWQGKSLRGAAQDPEAAVPPEKAAIEAFSPRPGWHRMALEVNNATGIAKMSFGGKSSEFKVAPPKAPSGAWTLSIGGFKGWLDEVLIRAE